MEDFTKVPKPNAPEKPTGGREFDVARPTSVQQKSDVVSVPAKKADVIADDKPRVDPFVTRRNEPVAAPAAPASKKTNKATALASKFKRKKADKPAASKSVLGADNDQPRSPKQKPSRKKLITWLLIAAAVLIVIAGGLFLWKKATAPVNITRVETLRSLSSRVKDAPVQEKFAASEPIMVHFEYKSAKTGTVVAYQVVDKDNKVVRSGETVALKTDDKGQDSGQRYISIVNTPNTKLPAGKYTVRLKVGNDTVKTVKFEVK